MTTHEQNIEALKKRVIELNNIAEATNDLDEKNIINLEKKAAILKIIEESRKKEGEFTREELEFIIEQRVELNKIEKELKRHNTQLTESNKNREKANQLVRTMSSELVKIWQTLQNHDKVIKSTNLSLGLTGVKADLMRTSFEESARHVVSLGGNMEDIQTIMQGYADETGRARALSAETVKSIAEIGKGTGLGVEAATQLAAKFELIGLNGISVNSQVQTIIDKTERMGVNTTKVLKNINDNFRRLNTYTFQQGVKGFGQMASYAEKFKIDMNDALNAADISRTLEGAIGLTAKLQVMGGEFAKTDPFEMLFLSRNDPAKFTEKIADMTKGLVTFRQMSDGTFEQFISPADRDRIANVAQSMGMEAASLTQIVQRQAEIQKMRKDTQGLGLSKEQQELIEGAAVFNNESGKFQVRIGAHLKDISTLSGTQASRFESERKTLEARAKEAQTFNEVLEVTINELKAIALPILGQINQGLALMRPVLEGFTNIVEALGPGGAIASLMLISLGIKGAAMGLAAASKSLAGAFIKNKVTSGDIAKETKDATPTKGVKGAGGMASMGKGIGTGAAAAGIGFGVKLAAEGISELATAMKELDSTQIWGLAGVMAAISISAFPMSTAIVAIGTAGKFAAPGLLALGAAAVGIGFGVNLAAKGIGAMAEGIGSLISKAGESEGNLFKLAGGIATIGLALGSFGLTGTLGLASFGITMGLIAATAPSMEKVGTAFEQMNKGVTQLVANKENLKEIKDILDSISQFKAIETGAFSELVKVLNKPLRVEFDSKEVAIAANITLDIDGHKFMEKVYKPKTAKIKDLRDLQGYQV